MKNIFYSYSNHNDNIVNTYLNVCEYFKNNENIHIMDVDYTYENNLSLLDKITNYIDNSSIFICDITPDYIINKLHNDIHNNTNIYDISNNEIENYYEKLYPVINSNVSMELGYALYSMKQNIILIKNKNSSIKLLPSLLLGFYILEYDIEQEDYYLTITNKIQEYAQNIQYSSGYSTFKYKISNISRLLITELLDIQGFKNYQIKYNNDNKYLILYKNNTTRLIDIKTKTLELKKNKIDLSHGTQLYNELQHIELLIELKLLNQNT